MNTADKKKKKTFGLWRVLLVLIGVIIIASATFIIWANTTNPVMDSGINALLSDDRVQVTQEPWIVFQPETLNPTTGIIFYPGGKVDPRSYAPIMHDLAGEGYLTVIVPMPLNLAFTGINKADEVVSAYPAIDSWIISGHSLGGAMAANYIYNNPGKMQGLILYASYPADSNDLSESNTPVLSIYGTEDGGIEKLTTSPDLLPVDTKIVIIDGGNHAQFGDYGLQKGDGTAFISRDEQQSEIVNATLEWLSSIRTP